MNSDDGSSIESIGPAAKSKRETKGKRKRNRALEEEESEDEEASITEDVPKETALTEGEEDQEEEEEEETGEIGRTTRSRERREQQQNSPSQSKNLDEGLEDFDEEPDHEDSKENNERGPTSQKKGRNQGKSFGVRTTDHSQSNNDMDFVEEEGSHEEDEENPSGQYDEVEECAVPVNFKQLRACVRCKLIKESSQFERDGCENCRDNERDIATTTMFEGCICMIEPEQSWVAKWQSMRGLKPGIYAINVLDNNNDEDLDYYEEGFLEEE